MDKYIFQLEDRAKELDLAILNTSLCGFDWYFWVISHQESKSKQTTIVVNNHFPRSTYYWNYKVTSIFLENCTYYSKGGSDFRISLSILFLSQISTLNFCSWPCFLLLVLQGSVSLSYNLTAPHQAGNSGILNHRHTLRIRSTTFLYIMKGSHLSTLKTIFPQHQCLLWPQDHQPNNLFAPQPVADGEFMQEDLRPLWDGYLGRCILYCLLVGWSSSCTWWYLD